MGSQASWAGSAGGRSHGRIDAETFARQGRGESGQRYRSDMQGYEECLGKPDNVHPDIPDRIESSHRSWAGNDCAADIEILHLHVGGRQAGYEGAGGTAVGKNRHLRWLGI